MNTWDKIRTSLLTRRPNIDSSVRAVVNQVVAKKTKTRAFKANGAAIFVSSFFDEYFADPETNEEPIVDDDIHDVKSNWLD